MHIYYGDGKGKTTAAIGLACRCAGRGKRVLFTAFLKGKNSGEFINECFFETDQFDFCNRFWYELDKCEQEAEKASAQNRLLAIADNINDYDMIILDEFLDAIIFGCLEKTFAIELVRTMYGKTEIVITGHQRVEELFEIADYVTEMKKEKHPYDKGVTGREGIEF